MFYFCAIKLIVTYGCKVNTMFRQWQIVMIVCLLMTDVEACIS